MSVPTVLACPAARQARKTGLQAKRPIVAKWFAATSYGAWNQMEIFDYDNILLLPRKCRVESR